MANLGRMCKLVLCSDCLCEAALAAPALLRPEGTIEHTQSRSADYSSSRGGLGIDGDRCGLAFFGASEVSRFSIVDESLQDDGKHNIHETQSSNGCKNEKWMLHGKPPFKRLFLSA
jgi:hypothetical protein